MVQREELGQLLAAVAHQITNVQIRKQWQYDFASADPAFRQKFISDFLATAVGKFGIDPRYAEEARSRMELHASLSEPDSSREEPKKRLLRQKTSFEIKMEEQLKRTDAKVKQLETELIRNRNEAADLKAQLEAVFGSRSWRITAPLRLLSERLLRRNLKTE